MPETPSKVPVAGPRHHNRTTVLLRLLLLFGCTSEIHKNHPSFEKTPPLEQTPSNHTGNKNTNSSIHDYNINWNIAPEQMTEAWLEEVCKVIIANLSTITQDQYDQLVQEGARFHYGIQNYGTEPKLVAEALDISHKAAILENMRRTGDPKLHESELVFLKEICKHLYLQPYFVPERDSIYTTCLRQAMSIYAFVQILQIENEAIMFPKHIALRLKKEYYCDANNEQAPLYSAYERKIQQQYGIPYFIDTQTGLRCAILVNIANVYIQHQNYDFAFQYLYEAIRLNPYDASYYNTMFDLHKKMGNYDTSLSIYTKDIIDNSRDGWYYILITDLYLKTKQLSLANAALKKAQELDPKLEKVVKSIFTIE